MKIGASTANFYPLPIEQALDTLLNADFRTVEIFLNAPSEREPHFIKQLNRRLLEAGATVPALHPYSSFTEPFFLFSAYERRFADGLEEYKRQFEAAAILGAPYLILHGDRQHGILSVEQSLERYEALYDLGRTFGVSVAQENVVHYRSADLSYLRALRDTLGDKAHFVFDIKQAVRCGLSAQEVLEVMGDRLVHVHISDHTPDQDCLPPGKGAFDYPSFLKALSNHGYRGSLILELYRNGFDSVIDLQQSADYIHSLLKTVNSP